MGYVSRSDKNKYTSTSAKTCLPASLLLIAMATTDAAAQNEESTERAGVPRDIERITTTATRVGATGESGPLVISDVSQQELHMVSPAHIQEVLKFIAGAGVQRGNGQEYLPSLRSQVFTGAGACGGLLTAEDGIPLRAAGICNINELFEAHIDMASRVEVLKGPGSVLYGSNAIHGVINVITPDTTTGAGMLGYDYGSYGYNRLKLRSGKDFGDSGIGINASATQNSGYRDDENVSQEKVNIRHRFDGNGVTVTSGLTYTHLDQDTAGYISGFESYKDAEISQRNEDPNAFRKNSALRVWSNSEWDLGNNTYLSVTPYYRNQDMSFFMHFLPGTPLEENAQEGVGLQSVYVKPLSVNWHFQAGFDAEYTEGSLRQFQNGPTGGSAFLAETVPAGRHYDYAVDATQLAPFVSLTWRSGAWEVSVGARYEYMHYDYTNYMLAGRTRDDGSECGFGGCRYSRPPSGSDEFNNISPKLGISYRYSDALRLYANLSRGYRAPQATELYRLQRDQVVADLKSETAVNYEVGLQGSAEGVRYTLAAYTMYKDNFIFRDSDFFNVNDGKSRHQGIEAELQYAPFTTWDITAAASYARHTYEYEALLDGVSIDGNDIDTAPRLQANTRLGWNVSAQTRVEAEWQHVGQYFTDPENLHEYAGHDLFNVRVSTAITPQFTVFARVLNVTDTRYAERADYTSFGGDRYFPGLPRHYMVSAQYTW